MKLILYGKQKFLIQQYVKKVLKDFSNDGTLNVNFVHLNFENDDFSTILNEICSLSLGFDRKVIELDGCSFLSKKDSNEKDLTQLLNIFKKNDDDILLILVNEEQLINFDNSFIIEAKIVAN